MLKEEIKKYIKLKKDKKNYPGQFGLICQTCNSDNEIHITL